MNYTNHQQEYHTDLLHLYQMDCMELLRQTPDKHFELAIVDPPYGLGKKLSAGGKTKGFIMSSLHKDWDNLPPNAEYFKELKRVSKNQIIWGMNYFDLPPTRGIICWDKVMGGDTNFGAFELAWTSFDVRSRIFKFCSHGGFIAEPADLPKIHSCQKPVKLYKWLLENYAKPGDKILDTHLGSGSIAIACHYMGYDLTACELDPDYFNASIKRIEQETAQKDLFTTPEEQTTKEKHDNSD